MSHRIRRESRLRKRAKRGFRGYPIATIAFYGPDDTRASKVAVGIVASEEEKEPSIMRRWFSEGADVRLDYAIGNEVVAFLDSHGAKSVVLTDGIIGCPHQEGIDYPEGEKCLECPFWANRDRWTGEIIQ